MCKFFSFVTDPERFGGQRFFYDAVMRKESNPTETDSHSMICKKFGLEEDKCNKYEWDFDNTFTVDDIHSPVDDRIQAEEWARKLDISRIVKDVTFGGRTLQIGDVYVFKPLNWLHENADSFPSGWTEYMDPLTKTEIVITPAIYGSVSIGRRGETIPVHLHKFDYVIDPEMVELKWTRGAE